MAHDLLWDVCYLVMANSICQKREEKKKKKKERELAPTTCCLLFLLYNAEEDTPKLDHRVPEIAGPSLLFICLQILLYYIARISTIPCE